MGYLAEGRWIRTDQRPTGQFRRSDSQFRNWITPDGAAGPSGIAGFKAEAGRYHLYVSLACPWASRTLIFRSLKRLEAMVGLYLTHIKRHYYMSHRDINPSGIVPVGPALDFDAPPTRETARGSGPAAGGLGGDIHPRATLSL